MSKPTITSARWADLGSNNTAPASGTRDTGFLNAGTVISSYINALFLQAYLWFFFLDSLFSSAGAYTAPVNESVTVSGTGLYKFGTRTKYITPASGHERSDSQAFTLTSAGSFGPTASGSQVIPLPDDINIVGRRLLSIQAHVTTSAGAGTREVQFNSSSVVDNSSETIHSNATATSTSSNYTINPTANLPFVLLDAKVYVLVVVLIAGDTLHSIKVTYDQP